MYRHQADFLKKECCPPRVWINVFGPMKSTCLAYLFTITAFVLCGARAAALPPDWYLPLRDAVYEQTLTADQITRLYEETKQRAEQTLTGTALFITLSRCEYLMGRTYHNDEQDAAAVACYERGIAWAQKSLDETPSSEGWQMLAENLSQACVVMRSTAYVMANAAKAEKYVTNALALNPGNIAAQYMDAAKYIYVPAPFTRYRRGIQQLEEIAEKNDAEMERDDRFNIYSALGYGYLKRKKYQDARRWLEKSLSVYPTNKFAQWLLNQTK